MYHLFIKYVGIDHIVDMRTTTQQMAEEYFDNKRSVFGGMVGYDGPETTYYASLRLSEQDFRKVVKTAKENKANVPGFQSPAERHMQKAAKQYYALIASRRKLSRRYVPEGRRPREQTELTDNLIKQIKKGTKKWVDKYAASDDTLCRLESDLVHIVQEYCRGHRKSVSTAPAKMGGKIEAKALQEVLDSDTPNISEAEKALRGWWESARGPSEKRNIAHSHLFSVPLTSLVRAGGNMTVSLNNTKGAATATLDFKGATLGAIHGALGVVGITKFTFTKLMILTHKMPMPMPLLFQGDILGVDTEIELRDLFTALAPNQQMLVFTPDIKKNAGKVSKLQALYNKTIDQNRKGLTRVAAPSVVRSATGILDNIRSVLIEQNKQYKKSEPNEIVMLGFDQRKKQQVHFYHEGKKSTLSFQVNSGDEDTLSIQVGHAGINSTPDDTYIYVESLKKALEAHGQAREAVKARKAGKAASQTQNADMSGEELDADEALAVLNSMPSS